MCMFLCDMSILLKLLIILSWFETKCQFHPRADNGIAFQGNSFSQKDKYKGNENRGKKVEKFYFHSGTRKSFSSNLWKINFI